MSLPLNIIAMPPRSSADRRCFDCGIYVPIEGVYGPPTVELRGGDGVYFRELLSDHWFCEAHGQMQWDRHNWLCSPAVARRRRWVRSEIKRRRVVVRAWDASLASAQLDLFRMAS